MGTDFSVLLLGNIIYVGLVTIAQKRLDWMLGYSSVMHMGYIFPELRVPLSSPRLALFFSCLLMVFRSRVLRADWENRESAPNAGLMTWVSGKAMPLPDSLGFHIRCDWASGLREFRREIMIFERSRMAEIDRFHIFQIATVLALGVW